MSASDHLSSVQFQHVPDPRGTSYGHTMYAVRPGDMGTVGHLEWIGNTINDVFVRSDMRRLGVATELLRRAREVNPRLQHNTPDEQTDAGQAWAAARP